MVKIKRIAPISLLIGDSCSTITRLTEMACIVRSDLRLLSGNIYLIISSGILSGIIQLHCGCIIFFRHLEKGGCSLSRNIRPITATINSPYFIAFLPTIINGRTAGERHRERGASAGFKCCPTYKSSTLFSIF